MPDSSPNVFCGVDVTWGSRGREVSCVVLELSGVALHDPKESACVTQKLKKLAGDLLVFQTAASH